MKVYVIDRGEKALFYEGTLTRETARQIRAEIRWYFGWRKLKVYREDGSLYIMDADRVEKLRKEFFNKAVIA